MVFAGHGYLDERSGRGYWVPVDAPAVKSSPDLDTVMISVGHLVETLSQVRAHHILLIVDACFAGVFARMALDVPHDGNWNNPEEKPSRWALTAGRNQVVADESPFAKALQNVLLDNTELRISIKWIGSEIERRVSKTSNQLPWCGAIVPKEMEGGEFFFHRQTPAPNLAVLPWQTITAEELPQRLRHGSRAHLERLKKGRFQFLRIENLLLTNLTNPSFFETKVKAGSEETPLLQALIPLWRQEKPHAIVLGEGGMGKTVSLVQLWEDLLDKPTIPVFIALNEYNAAPALKKATSCSATSPGNASA
ncbi:MAG: caspase family protein [Saprospiraceae bacterium]|nr:caspase family protein [Saprospiraceae bacterium]